MSQTTDDRSLYHLHDAGYKHMLSSNHLFLELLQTFVDAGWVEFVDEQSLIRVDKSFITPDYRSKEADLIYRVNLKDQDVIFYLLTEFQSTVDFTMPFRLLTYMLEIWRDVINNTPRNEVSQKGFRLPVIIPLVLYTGENSWTAAKNFREILQGHENFGQYVLDFSYFLIDVNRYDPEVLKKISNTISSMFLLDQNYDILELTKRLTDISDFIKSLDLQSYQEFIRWFGINICTQLSIENSAQFLEILEKTSPKEVDGMISNLAQNIARAKEKAKIEGLEEGRQEGRQEGLEQGRRARNIEIARNMLQRKLPLTTVAEVTELPLSEVTKLWQEMIQTN